jgi:NAD(H)-dependent 7beta-hydroxy-3-oxo-delta4-cholenoic acid oxidoreductase
VYIIGTKTEEAARSAHCDREWEMLVCSPLGSGKENPPMKDLKTLFSPVRIATMELRNRIAMAPMGSDFGTPEGHVTETMIGYYEARAKGGVALIFVEVTSVVGSLKYIPNQLELWDDKFIPGFEKLAKAVHVHGAKLAPQLMHPGAESWSKVEPVGPSRIRSRVTREMPRELSVGEIEEIIEAFGQAARRARGAGCDGVEVHAAHAHMLVGAFMSPFRNKRFDAYGGSIEGRLKLPVEIIKRIKTRAGHDFPVILRISGDELIPGGRTIQETQYIAPMLVEAGADALEISRGVYPDLSWSIIPPTGTPLACNAPYAAAIKEVVDIPIIVVGRITSPLIAEHILRMGQADMVSMGRALLADPELPKKAAEGRFEDIAPCIGCHLGCTGAQAHGAMTCLINPTVGKEKEMALTVAAKPKRVVVVGGGPGGLEVARVAALRGHQVTLFEKESKLGGQLNLAVIPPFKQEMCLTLKYLSTQVEKVGVRVEMGREATPELIRELNPDVVIVATGAAPFIPDIPGTRKDNVFTAWDVLAGNAAQRARNIVVIGGGMVGCEVADFLADRGDNIVVGRRAVAIVTRQRDVALDMVTEPRQLLLERLREKEVRFITHAATKEILDDGVALDKNGEEVNISGIDCVVLARGAKSVDELSEKIQDKVAEVYVIGDAKTPRRALEAIAEGAQVGLLI